VEGGVSKHVAAKASWRAHVFVVLLFGHTWCLLSLLDNNIGLQGVHDVPTRVAPLCNMLCIAFIVKAHHSPLHGLSLLESCDRGHALRKHMLVDGNQAAFPAMFHEMYVIPLGVLDPASPKALPLAAGHGVETLPKPS
jgi:hypothetical protein